MVGSTNFLDQHPRVGHPACCDTQPLGMYSASYWAGNSWSPRLHASQAAKQSALWQGGRA
jgi:hypothetical protein